MPVQYKTRARTYTAHAHTQAGRQVGRYLLHEGSYLSHEDILIESLPVDDMDLDTAASPPIQ